MTATTHHRLGETIVRLVRTERFQSGVRGVLYLPNGASLHTLEDNPIPPGSYFLNPDETGKFRNWVIERTLGSRVASDRRRHVEIHRGNTLEDTEGCILLGCDTSEIGILKSRDALHIARRHLDRDIEDVRIWILNISEAF